MQQLELPTACGDGACNVHTQSSNFVRLSLTVVQHVTVTG